MRELRGIPTSGLLTELTLRIIAHDGEAMAVVRSLTALLERMTCGLPESRRFETAERIRDVADRLEQDRATVSHLIS